LKKQPLHVRKPRVQAAGGAAATVMTGRRRAAARRVREIASKLRAR